MHPARNLLDSFDSDYAAYMATFLNTLALVTSPTYILESPVGISQQIKKSILQNQCVVLWWISTCV